MCEVSCAKARRSVDPLHGVFALFSMFKTLHPNIIHLDFWVSAALLQCCVRGVPHLSPLPPRHSSALGPEGFLICSLQVGLGRFAS